MKDPLQRRACTSPGSTLAVGVALASNGRAVACGLVGLAVAGWAAGCGAPSGTEMDDAGTDAGDVVDAAPGPIDAPVPPAPTVCSRELRISFIPTHRVQLAVWIATSDRFATIALTDATAYRGIGNRPGALQMNSGFHWPVGRRENVLPGWAGARLAAGGAPFRRVIFRARVGEGFLSSAGSTPDAYRDTLDSYSCMSFVASVMDRDGLDAMTCASFSYNDMGRYITEADVAAGYAEPMETAPGFGTMRALDLSSAYPPRRDLRDAGDDHPNVARYAADALAAMPELDAVTLATPLGETRTELVWRVPDAWSSGPATVSVEVSREGDYGGPYDATAYPRPSAPRGAWDAWSQTYGYPYRGQPSVIFDVPIVLPAVGPVVDTWTRRSDAPTRRGTLDHGLTTFPIDDTIVDDPVGAPGSGADRLARAFDRSRVTVVIRAVDCRVE